MSIMSAMTTKPKRRKYVAIRTRKIIGQNIRDLMETVFEHETDKWTAFKDASGIARSSIQRIAGGEVGVSVDTLTLLANALHVDVADLLRSKPNRRRVGSSDSAPNTSH